MASWIIISAKSCLYKCSTLVFTSRQTLTDVTCKALQSVLFRAPHTIPFTQMTSPARDVALPKGAALILLRDEKSCLERKWAAYELRTTYCEIMWKNGRACKCMGSRFRAIPGALVILVLVQSLMLASFVMITTARCMRDDYCTLKLSAPECLVSQTLYCLCSHLEGITKCNYLGSLME